MKLTATTVALGTLLPSPLNARPRQHSAEDVADLIPSIRAVGMINPITVHALKKPKGKHGVLAGARRYRALLELASDPAIDAAAIPVMLAEGTDAELRELSIMENEQREEMNEVETLRSFGALRKADPKITDEQLAINFGVKVIDVRRIMRLADLHPEILQAYADKVIGQDIARAFGASSNQARQLEVWTAIKEKGRFYASDVKQLLGFSFDHSVKQKLAVVGNEAFVAGGGKLVTDLFSDAVSVEGTEILDAMFDAKLSEAKLAYLEQHPRIRFVDQSDVPAGQYGGIDWDLQINVEGTIRAKHRAEFDALNATIDQIEHDLEAAVDWENVDEGFELGDDPTAWPYDAGFDSAPLIADLATAKAALAAITPEKGVPDADLLGVASITSTGLNVVLYWPSREAAGLPALTRNTTREAAGSQTSAAEKQRRDYGLTKDAMGAMLIVRRDMVRDQLCYDHELALDFLLFTQARTLLRPTPSYGGGFHLTGQPVGIATPEVEDTSASKAPSKVRELAKTMTRAPTLAKVEAELQADNSFKHLDPIEGFNLFRRRDDKFKVTVVCYVAGAAIRGTDTYYGDPETPRFIEAVAHEYLGQNAMWQDSVTYDEAFFALINHKKRVALLDGWGQGEAAKRLKAGESAAFCAKIYQACFDVYLSSHSESETVRKLLGINEEDQGEIINWRPDWFDTNQPKKLANPEAEAIVAEAEDDDTDAAEEDARRKQAAIAEALGGDDTTLEGGELAQS